MRRDGHTSHPLGHETGKKEGTGTEAAPAVRRPRGGGGAFGRAYAATSDFSSLLSSAGTVVSA